MYDKHKLKKKYGALIKKHLSVRRVLVILLILFVVLFLSEAFKGIILLILFIPLAKYTVKLTKFINYLTIETMTGSTILMAYIYGPTIGGLTGLFLGAYAYLANGVAKLLAIVDVLLTAVMGFVTGFMMNLDFGTAFIISILLKNIVGFVVYSFVDPDRLQNIAYRSTHVIWNIAIVRILFELVYNLYKIL